MMGTLKSLKDYVETKLKRHWPNQHISFHPLRHFDNIDEKTDDYFVSFCIGDRFYAFRVPLVCAMDIDHSITQFVIKRVLEHPDAKPVNLHCGQDEPLPENTDD